jgi:hypothetical protein
MSATIAVSASVDSALRRAFSEASVRLQPDCKMTDVIDALKAMGIGVEVQDGVLVLQQGSTSFNTSLALRNFSKRPENVAFFVVDGAHPSQWSKERKIEYLRTHTDEQYRALIQSPVLDAGVKTMDPNMSRADYSNLTRSEKIAFLREFGSDAASRIMQKQL